LGVDAFYAFILVTAKVDNKENAAILLVVFHKNGLNSVKRALLFPQFQSRKGSAGAVGKHAKTGNTTHNWRAAFNALDKQQKELVEKIVAEHKFSDADIDVADEAAKAVLKYYQIKRDDK
jgi:hypothetical protein